MKTKAEASHRSDGAGGALADLEAQLEALWERGQGAFEDIQKEAELREVHARFLGSKGELTAALKQLRHLSKELRPKAGALANDVKVKLTQLSEQVLRDLRAEAREAELHRAAVDITLPGRAFPVGKLHPISRMCDELVRIFISMGFEVVEGPEIETQENNFVKLGFPEDHPAMDMQDSFYLEQPDALLLRTHTSNVQVREMQRRKPPMAVISPGAVYRRDDDATHSPKFFQLEGFLVDSHVTFAQLKGVLSTFLRRVFGTDAHIRFRPSYFPFVEPGGEVDVGFINKDGELQWMEVLGCGMIHPTVFNYVGYDPEVYTGFAFGMGVDRLAMLRYGVGNIRALYENDVRFLERV